MSHVLSYRLPAALLLALAVSLAWASTAAAQAVGTATPNAAGRGSTIAWVVDGIAPPVSARIPRSLTMDAAGFRLDRRAVARRCRQQQAELNECPAKSRIGTAVLTILVHRPTGTNEVPFDIVLYHGPKNSVLAVTDFIGIRVIPGSLKAADGGTQLTFDPLPEPPVIPTVEIRYEFKGVSADLGVSRKVTKRVRRGGKRVRKTVRYHLVKTPAECGAGTWPTTVTLGFPDGSSEPLEAPIPCRG